MTVYLVGAGPGDPGLITVRGAELLARADVVVHDRLVDPSLLQQAAPAAELVDVGKWPGASSGARQEEINALLVERGRAGLEVVRLKGGDPFVFGRGGEEALALAGAGVDFEVVPGVSAAVAVPAYAGVPVTHRGLSSSFVVVTGRAGEGRSGPDWEVLARSGATIVVLMGVAHRGEIAGRLLAAGLPPETPVAAVRWGTRPEQRSLRTTLAELGDADLEPPTTIVIGRVAGLDLAWFERRPLFGRRIVVTRATDQASTLVDRLRALGAETLELPTVAVRDPADGGAALARAAAELGRYDWVVFTSANAVDRLLALVPDARALGGARVAAVGPGTAARLGRWRVAPDLVPAEAVAESLLDALPDPPAGGGRVLLPRAAVGRDLLPDGLRARGWQVDVVEAYRTERVAPAPELVAAARAADAITFTSGSTVTGWVEAAGPDAVPPVVACIGPVTADAARACGLSVDVVADVHTIDGLVEALVATLRRPA